MPADEHPAAFGLDRPADPHLQLALGGYGRIEIHDDAPGGHQRPVHDEAERALVAVVAEQDHGPREIRIRSCGIDSRNDGASEDHGRAPRSQRSCDGSQILDELPRLAAPRLLVGRAQERRRMHGREHERRERRPDEPRGAR